MTEVIPLTGSPAGCCDAAIAPRTTPEEAQRLSEALQLLGHPIRVQILDMLAHSADHVCVCDLEGALPVKQPTVSHHLRLLREAGLIDCVRRGPWAYYFVNRDTLCALRERVATFLSGL